MTHGKTPTLLKPHTVPINYSETSKRGSYEELLSKLMLIKKLDHAPEHNNLHEAIEALSVLIEFLNANPDARENRLAQPLQKLFLALCDLLKGSKPAMLDVSKGGRPTRDTEAVKRASLIRMLDTLCEARIQKPSEWLARELKKTGVEDTSEEKGKKRGESETSTPITAKKLERWKSELYCKSLKGTDRAYDAMLARDRSFGKSMSPEQAKSLVRNRIRSLLASGF
jgi:hypothetical protein